MPYRVPGSKPLGDKDPEKENKEANKQRASNEVEVKERRPVATWNLNIHLDMVQDNNVNGTNMNHHVRACLVSWNTWKFGEQQPVRD